MGGERGVGEEAQKGGAKGFVLFSTLRVPAERLVPGGGLCYETGMKRRFWIGWALGLLAAAAPMGWAEDAVVEFYSTQAEADQYDLNETSVYELKRSINDSYDWARNFWRRAAEKFAAYPEAVQLCEKHERDYESTQRNEEMWVQSLIEPLTATGGRVFHFGYIDHEEKSCEGGILVLALDGSIRRRWVTCATSSGGWWSKWLRKWQAKAWRRTLEKRAAELKADAAAAFLHNRTDAAAHSLHATSWMGLNLYLIFPNYNPDPSEAQEEWADFVDVPGFLEFAKAEDAALQAWLAPRKAIVEQIKAEADPTDRLYWDVFDDGEHHRAGLLWVRWDGSVRQEWPDFGELSGIGAGKVR